MFSKVKSVVRKGYLYARGYFYKGVGKAACAMAAVMAGCLGCIDQLCYLIVR